MTTSRFVHAVALVAIAHASARAQSSTSSFRRGQELLQRHQLQSAESAFRTAATSKSPTERAAGERALAVVAWRYREDQPGALTHLQRALAIGMDTARTLLEWSRFELSRAQAGAAVGYAERAMADANDEESHRSAIHAAVTALVEPFLRARIDGETPPRGELTDPARLRLALAKLAPTADSFPGSPNDALALLHGALVLNDGPIALHAWQLYYLLDAGDTLRGVLAQPRRELARLLPGLGRSTQNRDERERLVRALADSRLFDAAALVARDPGAVAPRSKRVSEIVAYAAFTRRLSRATDEYYRRTLIGQANPAELRRLWIHQTRDLWPLLDWSSAGGAPTYYPAAVAPELQRRFGAIVRFGSTAGYYDLHYGHVVAGDAREVEQYAHRVRVKLVVTDGIVSNGFQSWAWDGTAEHGGLQTGDTIIQVRTAFVETPFLLWLGVASARRQAFESRTLAADSVADWDRAARDSAGFLPGVRERIVRDARLSLVDSLRRSGLEGDALRNAFILGWLQAARESGVFAHEGRHAIDRVLVPEATPDELEFRAKLSEVALASNPRIALAAMLHASIGDATAHGRANARVMLGLIRWMRAHASSVQGLDASRPMLPQLPLLSEAQLRQAFRAMDPLASGTAHVGSS